jgi:hypothetical protein
MARQRAQGINPVGINENPSGSLVQMTNEMDQFPGAIPIKNPLGADMQIAVTGAMRNGKP